MSNKNKNILLGVLIVEIISMTVAFAALSTNLRINGTTGEVCGVFGNGQAGTVCITSSYYNSSYSSAGNYNADFEDMTNVGSGITTVAGLEATGLKGYSLAKVEEMLTKGASSCDVGSAVGCYMTSGGYCQIFDNGDVFCYGEWGDNVSVNYDGVAF